MRKIAVVLVLLFGVTLASSVAFGENLPRVQTKYDQGTEDFYEPWDTDNERYGVINSSEGFAYKGEIAEGDKVIGIDPNRVALEDTQGSGDISVFDLSTLEKIWTFNETGNAEGNVIGFRDSKVYTLAQTNPNTVHAYDSGGEVWSYQFRSENISSTGMAENNAGMVGTEKIYWISDSRITHIGLDGSNPTDIYIDKSGCDPDFNSTTNQMVADCSEDLQGYESTPESTRINPTDKGIGIPFGFGDQVEDINGDSYRYPPHSQMGHEWVAWLGDTNPTTVYVYELFGSYQDGNSSILTEFVNPEELKIFKNKQNTQSIHNCGRIYCDIHKVNLETGQLEKFEGTYAPPFLESGTQWYEISSDHIIGQRRFYDPLFGTFFDGWGPGEDGINEPEYTGLDSSIPYSEVTEVEAYDSGNLAYLLVGDYSTEYTDMGNYLVWNLLKNKYARSVEIMRPNGDENYYIQEVTWQTGETDYLIADTPTSNIKAVIPDHEYDDYVHLGNDYIYIRKAVVSSCKVSVYNTRYKKVNTKNVCGFITTTEEFTFVSDGDDLEVYSPDLSERIFKLGRMPDPDELYIAEDGYIIDQSGSNAKVYGPPKNKGLYYGQHVLVTNTLASSTTNGLENASDGYIDISDDVKVHPMGITNITIRDYKNPDTNTLLKFSVEPRYISESTKVNFVIDNLPRSTDVVHIYSGSERKTTVPVVHPNDSITLNTPIDTDRNSSLVAFSVLTDPIPDTFSVVAKEIEKRESCSGETVTALSDGTLSEEDADCGDTSQTVEGVSVSGEFGSTDYKINAPDGDFENVTISNNTDPITLQTYYTNHSNIKEVKAIIFNETVILNNTISEGIQQRKRAVMFEDLNGEVTNLTATNELFTQTEQHNATGEETVTVGVAENGSYEFTKDINVITTSGTNTRGDTQTVPELIPRAQDVDAIIGDFEVRTLYIPDNIDPSTLTSKETIDMIRNTTLIGGERVEAIDINQLNKSIVEFNESRFDINASVVYSPENITTLNKSLLQFNNSETIQWRACNFSMQRPSGAGEFNSVFLNQTKLNLTPNQVTVGEDVYPYPSEGERMHVNDSTKANLTIFVDRVKIDGCAFRIQPAHRENVLLPSVPTDGSATFEPLLNTIYKNTRNVVEPFGLIGDYLDSTSGKEPASGFGADPTTGNVVVNVTLLKRGAADEFGSTVAEYTLNKTDGEVEVNIDDLNPRRQYRVFEDGNLWKTVTSSSTGDVTITKVGGWSKHNYTVITFESVAPTQTGPGVGGGGGAVGGGGGGIIETITSIQPSGLTPILSVIGIIFLIIGGVLAWTRYSERRGGNIKWD